MAQIDFEYIQKALTEVVEYLKCLLVLNTNEKKLMLRKRAIIKQKVRLNLNLRVIGPAEKEKSPTKRGKGLRTQTALVTVIITPSQQNFVKSLR